MDIFTDVFSQNMWIIYIAGVVLFIIGFFAIRKLVMFLLTWIYREKWHLSKLDNEDPYERYFAIRALRKDGTLKALPQLIETLRHDEDMDICEEAYLSIDMIIERLSKRGVEAYKGLIIDIVANHWNTDFSRIKAIHLIGKYNIIEIEDILIQLLKTEKQSAILKEIIITLGNLKSKKAAPELFSILLGKKKDDLYREVFAFIRMMDLREYVEKIHNLVTNECHTADTYGEEGEYTYCYELSKTLINMGNKKEGSRLLNKRLAFLNNLKIPFSGDAENEENEIINRNYFLREREMQLIKETLKDEAEYVDH
ncbi:MAG: HEAT repeat domain-containing protein [Spirochaetales bacterium]|nr:HEAT repeat domain-containing protein [Spirochaetales bacterium]